MKELYSDCPVEYTITLIDDKWKVLILRELLTGIKRTNQLQSNIIGVSPKMLTQNLRELEEDGLVERTVYQEVPPRVEYSLTRAGEDLRPVLAAMEKYGKKYRKTVRNYC